MVADRRGSSARRSIVILGFMAAGKTTIGKRLAARLGMPFLDTDCEIERAIGCSVAEIFARFGELEFRAAERRLISRLLGGEPRILSVGGGAYLDQEMRQAINAQAMTVWLDPPFELIFERLTRSNDRPLASGRSADELRRLWDERRENYAEAQLRVEISDADPDKTVEIILQAL
jgi:shikimate kinase/3-dehydroquinate synthase